MSFRYEEVVGDIWDARAASDEAHGGQNGFVVVPTNLDGAMGRGLALQCKRRYADASADYASLPRGERFFHPYWWTWGGSDAESTRCRVVMLAVKDDWREPADLGLVAYGVGRLAEWLLAQSPEREPHAFVPLLGCGFGGLAEADVLPLLLRGLGEAGAPFTLVRPGPQVRERYGWSMRPSAGHADRVAP